MCYIIKIIIIIVNVFLSLSRQIHQTCRFSLTLYPCERGRGTFLLADLMQLTTIGYSSPVTGALYVTQFNLVDLVMIHHFQAVPIGKKNYQLEQYSPIYFFAVEFNASDLQVRSKIVDVRVLNLADRAIIDSPFAAFHVLCPVHSVLATKKKERFFPINIHR